MMLSEAASAANSLANVSSAEINASQDLLKQAIGFYSANIKSYAKWFEISEVNKNEETFTSYKVVYRFLPKDLNESIKQVVVWKRFRDFKDLNQFMANHHAALHRRDKFPEFVKSKFFGRFDDKVIEERRQYSLRLLQFIGSQSHLYKTDKFIEFFCTEGATFTDYQTSESMTGRVLQPTLSPEKLKRSETSSTTNNLTVLITDIGSFIDSHCSSSNPNSYDYVIDNLVKTRKLLTLSATAQNTSAKSSSTNLNNNNASSTSLSTATSAADKYLKSALSNLSDFMAEMDLNRASSGDVSSERKNFLKSVYRRINSLMDESLLARQKASTPLEVTGAGNGKAAATPTASPEANFLNDWILSDFNLVSNDFNNELSFISGNLFDLSFNYKLVRLINDKCFLMKLRHATSDSNGNNSDTSTNEYFFLKRLQKSFNPSLTSKSLVPFKNRIPFMCQLLKYYESESTIFLLIEYHKYGPVYPHLLRLIRHSIQSYPENLPELYNFLSTSSFAAHSTLHAVSVGGANKAAMSSSITNVIESKQQQQQQQQQQPQRRIRFSRSFSGFSYSLRRSSSSSSLLLSNVPKSSHVPKETAATESTTTTDKRRAQSHSHSVKLTVLTTPVEIQPEVDKTIFSSSSMSPPSELAASMSLSSSSSSSGLDAMDNNASTTPRDREESSKIEFSSGGGGSSRVVFKATTTATNSNSTISPSCTTDEDKKSPSWSSKKQQKSTNEMNQPVSKYQKQVKLWLAQVLCALRNLHEMGIVCKDLTSDDLVLSQSGDILLSYVSKWNLVEESIKKRAIDELYSAPELSGMVNNPVGESCDWWSFGVIAYELITTQKFANFHERHEIYVDKINFPSDFKCDLGKDLIRKLLRINPAKRLTREQIQQHPYFSETDWISLEESFWKSK